MSAINVNSITGRTGSHGPVLTGLTTVTGDLHVGGGVSFSGITTVTNGLHVTGGSVGIGTDSPSTALHISSTLPVLRLQDSDSTGNAALQRIEALPSAGATQWFVGQNSLTDTELYVQNVTNDAIRFGTNNTERVRITSGGNVGVGSTIPVRKLDVVDSGASGAVIRSQITDNNGGYLAYEALNSSGTSVFSVTHNGRISLAEGINFQNTGAGSSTTATSHILDDYEEGTWTPTTANFTHSVNSNDCFYTKIGRRVFVHGQLSRDQVSAPTTDYFEIRGMPFARGTNLRSIEGSFWVDNGGTATDYIGGLSYFYTTNALIFAIGSNPSQQAATRYVQGNYFNDGRGLLFYVSYTVD